MNKAGIIRKKECGFTLIELVTVIILLAILSVYAASKWPGDHSLKMPAQAELLAAHIRHVQALAMDWGQPLRLTISANSYSVSCVTAMATPPCNNSPVIDPATNEAFTILLQSGISLTGTAMTDFDTLGRPISSGALITSTPARVFTLNADGLNQSVTLSPLTGFVAL